MHKGRRDDVDLPYYAAWRAGRLEDDEQADAEPRRALRPDVDSFAQYGEFLPFMEKGRPQDADNIQPRLGFAYQWNDRTVIRGGSGKYYAEVITPVVLYALEPATIAVLEVANDGRPDFALNPFNGPAPTFEQALTRFCSAPSRPPTSPRGGPEFRGCGAVRPPGRGRDGAAGGVRARAADVADVHRRAATDRELDVGRGRLRTPAAATRSSSRRTSTSAGGMPAASASTTPTRLPRAAAVSEFGIVAMTPFTGRSAYHALQTAFNKRMSNRWQAGATYTLGGLWSAEGQPLTGVLGSVPQEVPFTVAEDLGGPTGWTFAQSDQRHRAVFNGIWQVGPRLPGERGALLRRGQSRGQQLRRRSAQPRGRRRTAPTSGWHDRPEERVHPACAESDGHSRSAADCRSRAAYRWT